MNMAIKYVLPENVSAGTKAIWLRRILSGLASARRCARRSRAGRCTSTTAAKRSPSTRRVPAIGNALSTPRTSKG